MTFGLGPFGFSFSGHPTPEIPALPQGQLVSSRSINAQGLFVQAGDGTGAFAPMTDTMQRAACLIAYNVKMPDRIDAALDADVDSQIRQALEPITGGDEPAAEILEVISSNDGRFTTYTGVRIKDLKTGDVRVIPARTR